MPATSHEAFDHPSEKVLSPSLLAHVVLRTTPAKFNAMIDFYVDFLGGSITHKNEMLCFITYDEEHHRIALLSIPGLRPKQPLSAGLEHIAFSYPTMYALLLAYRQRKCRGMLPVWSVNHGPTNSIYYQDPDGNQLETQVDNFDNVDDATAFFHTSEFAENPIGVDVDPEELIERLRKGEDEASLKKRREVGPRMALPAAIPMPIT